MSVSIEEPTMSLLRRLAQASLITTSLLGLVLCPHSKVEESFNLQATHDLFYFGVLGDSDFYDHLKYPGVVPRTFAGPLLLSMACRFIGLVVSPLFALAEHPLVVQFLARLLLLMANWHAWFRLARALDNTNNNNNKSLIGSYLLLITACQFHLPYYSSRMLPNTFALVLVLHAYAEWINGHVTRAASCLVVATAVFRCDVLLLLFTVGITWIIQGHLTILGALQVGLPAAMLSLLATVPFDSLLWDNDRSGSNQWPVTIMWPEGTVFYYNAILGKSSDWGTSPWHWYLSTAIPKAMLLTLLLVPLAVIRLPICRYLDSTWLPYLLPTTIGFVALYSCLGHKELRFLFPIMPMLNLAAAVGMTKLHEQWSLRSIVRMKKSNSVIVRWCAIVAGIGSILITLLGSMVFLQVSRRNYPGGQALELLTRHMETNAENVHDARVWIDVASAMSGVSLFGQRDAMYRTGVKTWDKGGYEQEHDRQNFAQYTHLLSEHDNVPGYHVVHVAQGHPRIDKRRASIVTEDAIYVLERNDYGSTLVQ